MSYDLYIHFKSPEFPIEEWTEILSWFDAIDRQRDPQRRLKRQQLGIMDSNFCLIPDSLLFKLAAKFDEDEL